MKYTRVLVGSFAAIFLWVAGCSNDTGPSADAGQDGAADLLADRGVVPLTVEPGDDGHGQVGEQLAAGAVRAGRVTETTQLLSGIKVEGKIGDFKLYNDRVAFIIKAARPSSGYGPYGGELLDAMRLGQPGSKGHSIWGEWAVGVGAQIVNPTTVGVVSDGSDGRALVRVVGSAQAFPLLATLLPSAAFPPPVHVVIDYSLSADSDVLDISWRLINKTNEDVVIPGTIMVLIGGDNNQFFVKGAGFDVDEVGITDRVASVSEDIGYGLISLDTDMLPLLVFTGAWAVRLSRVDVPAAGEGSLNFKLVVGEGDTDKTLANMRDALGESHPNRLSGTIVDPAGQPVADARIHVVEAADADESINRTRSAADGTYSLALTPGAYNLNVYSDGRAPTDPVMHTMTAADATLDIAVGPTSTLNYTVKDDAGEDIPAKVSIVPATPRAAPPKNSGEVRLPGGVERIIFHTPGPGMVNLPPGDYAITVSRGFEYELGTMNLVIAADAVETHDFVLSRSVDTTGYMSSDFHLHAMFSPDSNDLYEHKVRALAAEHIELPVASEHDYIADYNPAIGTLGLQQYLRGIVGDEISTVAFGHFNAFPIVADVDKPNNGALLWHKLTPKELFGNVRDAWPDAVLQLNHARKGSLDGYFTAVVFDPETGSFGWENGWSDNWDAMEVFNRVTGDNPQQKKLVKDWFSLLDHGIVRTATGNSDSHEAIGSEPGYPRNYVAVSATMPSAVDLAEFTASVKQGRVIISGGIFVTAHVGTKTIGDTVDASSGSVDLAIKVQAPSWVSVDTMEVIVGGVFGGTTVHTVDLSMAPGPVVRYDATLNIAVTQDNWVVVLVTGEGNLDPVVVGDRPLGMTNPIFLDFDGNGSYDAPKSLQISQ